jgi:hypothetical protein
MKIFEIPYSPRKVFIPIHAALETHRFNVLVAHRRMGKSVGAVNHVIKMAAICQKTRPHYAIIFPLRVQAKEVMWDYLKYYTRGLPEYKANESDLYVEFGGRKISLYGADNPDAMRGTYFDGAVLDEYAQTKPEVFDEVILPALSDREGWAVITGTPHGMNHFHAILELAKKKMAEGDPLWWAGVYSVYNSGVYGKEWIDLQRAIMSPNKFKQEYECDFNASDDNVCVPIELTAKARERKIPEEDYKDEPIIMGVDVARFGGDACSITLRQGRHTETPIKYKGINNMDFADKIAYWIDTRSVDTVFVDAGRGEGVIDRLRQLGYTNIVEVNFGAQALDHKHYENRRAEMWDKAKQFLQDGGDLPDCPELINDLTSPTYFFSTKNRMQIEAKEKIKERIGRSTDSGDSFVLTFAAPVVGFHRGRRTARQSREERDKLQFANTSYNPLESFKRPWASKGRRKVGF